MSADLQRFYSDLGRCAKEGGVVSVIIDADCEHWYDALTSMAEILEPYSLMLTPQCQVHGCFIFDDEFEISVVFPSSSFHLYPQCPSKEWCCNSGKCEHTPT